MQTRRWKLGRGRDGPFLSCSRVAGNQAVARPWPRVASVHPSLFEAPSEALPHPGIRGRLELTKEAKNPCPPIPGPVPQTLLGQKCGWCLVMTGQTLPEQTPPPPHSTNSRSPFPSLTLQHLHSHLQDSIFLAQTEGRGFYHLPKSTSSESLPCHTHTQSP